MNVETEKILNLAQEARELIFEFEKQESLISDAYIKEVSIDENGKVIYVEDTYEGLKIYSLTEISKVFSIAMNGFGPISASFYEALDIAIDELEDDYKKMSESEFKEYVGNLYFMQFRCEEIFERLKNIEKEAAQLIE